MEQSGRSSRLHYRTLLVVFAIGLGAGLSAREWVVSAYAQMNPGQQRVETNQGLNQLNSKADEILDILRSGTLKVRVMGTDKTSESAQSILFFAEDPAKDPAGDGQNAEPVKPNAARGAPSP